MYDVVALGELLIDFTQIGVSSAGMKLFEQNPGGAVANVLAAITKLGGKGAFLGKVGSDMHGRFLKETLDRAGIDTRGLILSDSVFTTLAFVALSETGERTFSFARKPGADTQILPKELDEALLGDTRVFHFGSLSLTDEPARSATHRAVQVAKSHGAIISYDPNYREPLWSDIATAKKRMRELLPSVDIMKLSDEETSLLTDDTAPEEAAHFLNSLGISCVAVTLGKKGALVSVDGKSDVVSGYPNSAIDTTGAGDAFWGGFLHRMFALHKTPAAMTLQDAADCASWGNAVATCCVQKRGAIPAMPTLDEVIALMQTRSA